MKIISRCVMDWDGNVIEEDSFEYCGPVAECKSSGSAPQPTDPYAQAGAQYGLATGTANYNAALNRTNSSNPLGSSTWSVGRSNGPGGWNPWGGGPALTASAFQGGGAPSMSTGTQGSPYSGVLGSSGLSGPGGSGRGGVFTPGISGGSPMYSFGGGSEAPKYSQQTSLTPWANQMLQSPIDTSNIAGVGKQLNTNSIAGLGNIDTSNVPGMPGGPDLTGSLNSTRNAMYNQSMGYLAPQERQQTESQNAQLAAQGATPGSEAWNNAQGNLGRQQTFANQQAVDSAIGAGNQEQATLYGLGTQGLNNQLNMGNASLQNQMNFGNSSLQNQLAVRNAPISEYEQLQGNGSGGQINAQTPDISGAFGQQYQGALAGYNANTATNNANTQAAAGAGTSALMAWAMLGAAF